MLSFIHYVTQALTTLHIRRNEIGNQGAQYLANALRQNNVTYLHLHSINHLLRYTDTHHT